MSEEVKVLVEAFQSNNAETQAMIADMTLKFTNVIRAMGVALVYIVVSQFKTNNTVSVVQNDVKHVVEHINKEKQ